MALARNLASGLRPASPARPAWSLSANIFCELSSLALCFAVGRTQLARMTALPFLLLFTAPALLVAGQRLGGAWNLATLCGLFLLVPLTDLALGIDETSPGADGPPGRRLSFRAITWLAVPAQVAVVCWSAATAAHGELHGLALAAFLLSTGATTGTVGITIAHELVHRKSRFERVLGAVLLATVCYMHWGIEHLAGHHRFVATPRDPASSRFGESLYAFLPRSIWGSYRSAREIECRRLSRLGRSPWHVCNRMLWFALCPAALAVGLGAVLGLAAAIFFLAQSAIAVALLEVVNYVEHYGLSRRRLGDGRFEKVTEMHSWNASHRFSNRGLFNLQRHSDHPLEASRPYERLRHHPQSPQLPMGYGAMVVLALVPPLWRWVMDPRVLEQQGQTGAAAAASRLRAGGIARPQLA